MKLHLKLAITLLITLMALSTLIVLYYPSDNTQPVKKLTKKERLLSKFSQEIEMTMDPKLRSVPHERLIEAQQYTKQLIQKSRGVEKAAISGVTWSNMGPDNVGGRTRALLFDPNDGTNKRVFAGGVSGGLWKNDDITMAASAWTRINDFLDNLTITSLAVDPNNSMTFYAGTGESYTQVTPGLGVFKSTDGGTNWSQVTGTNDFKYVNEVLIRNEGGTSVIYVAGARKYVGETISNPGNTFLGMAGLYRSADNGMNWSQVIPNNDNSTVPNVDDIGLDADGHLWASTGSNASGHKGGDIFECTDANCDGTGKFTKKFDASANGFNDADRTVIALAPSDADRIYAVAGKDNAGNTDVEFLIKSTNNFGSFTQPTIPKNYDLNTCTASQTDHFTRGQATYDLCMTVHPTNPDLVLLGGIDVYRTTDGFSNTAHIGSWFQGTAPCDKEIHADQHIFLFRPGSSNEVIFGNDGGVYYSSDAGNSAIAAPSFAHHVKDYNVSQMYAVDISSASGATEYIAGLQDNSTQEWDAGSGKTTSEAVGGDGAYCHIDQNQTMVQIGAYIYNDFTQTLDEWANKEQINPTPQTGRFINPSDYDDTNNVLYSASNADQLCKTTGIGAASPTLTDGNVVMGAALGGSKATTIRVDRNDPTTIYVGTDAGKVYKIPNANTATLTSTDISTGLPTGWISSIDVQMGNSMHMLVTLSNFGVVSVWESTNGGTSWTNVEGNLPDMPVRWGIFSPDNSDHAFLATSLGIWSTDNLDGGSTNWGVTNTGLANVRVDMLKYRSSDKTIIAGTHGRGVYTFKFSSGCDDNLTVTDNPASGTHQANLTVQSNPSGAVSVNTSAVFRAGQSVTLNSDFMVSQGATFEAQIGSCEN